MSNLERLEKFYDSRARFEKDMHLSHVHPECVYRVVGSEKLHPLTRQCATASEIEEAAAETFATWDMSRLETVSTHECGDTIYVHRRGNVVFLPDKSLLDTEFVDKLTFKDGAIVEYLQFVDTFAIKDFLDDKQPQNIADA